MSNDVHTQARTDAAVSAYLNDEPSRFHISERIEDFTPTGMVVDLLHFADRHGLSIDLRMAGVYYRGEAGTCERCGTTPAEARACAGDREPETCSGSVPHAFVRDGYCFDDNKEN
jgi:hypothetical protein